MRQDFDTQSKVVEDKCEKKVDRVPILVDSFNSYKFSNCGRMNSTTLI
jgi:hypothetical protein